MFLSVSPSKRFSDLLDEKNESLPVEEDGRNVTLPLYKGLE